MRKNVFLGRSTEILLQPTIWVFPIIIITVILLYYVQFDREIVKNISAIANFFTVAGFSLFAAITVFISLSLTGKSVPGAREESAKFYRVLYEIAGCILFTALFLSLLPVLGESFHQIIVYKYIVPFVIVFSSLSLFNSLWLLQQILSFPRK